MGPRGRPGRHAGAAPRLAQPPLQRRIPRRRRDAPGSHGRQQGAETDERDGSGASTAEQDGSERSAGEGRGARPDPTATGDGPAG